MYVHCTQLTLLCHLYIPVSHVHTYIKVIPNRAILLQPKLPLRDRAKISSGIYLGNGFVTHHLSRFTIDKKYFISFFFLQCTILLLLSLYRVGKKQPLSSVVLVPYMQLSDQFQTHFIKTKHSPKDGPQGKRYARPCLRCLCVKSIFLDDIFSEIFPQLALLGFKVMTLLIAFFLKKKVRI